MNLTAVDFVAFVNERGIVFCQEEIDAESEQRFVEICDPERVYEICVQALKRRNNESKRTN